MKRYEKLGDVMLSSLMFGEQSAFDIAQTFYARYKMDLAEDLIDYLRTGFVVARPNLFAMGKPVEHNGKRGWLIRFAAGEMDHLLSVLPCPLDFIAFCRNNDKNLRIISTEAFIARAVRKAKHDRTKMQANGS